MFCVQYDDQGNISATVVTDQIPECQNQLVFEDFVNIQNKRVNLSTLELEDIIN